MKTFDFYNVLSVSNFSFCACKFCLKVSSWDVKTLKMINLSSEYKKIFFFSFVNHSSSEGNGADEEGRPRLEMRRGFEDLSFLRPIVSLSLRYFN